MRTLTKLIISLSLISQPFLINQPIVEIAEPKKVEIVEFQSFSKLETIPLPELPSERLQNAPKPQSNAVHNCNELRLRMSQLGISGAELDAAVELGRVESNCRSSARNKSSGACNIYQELPCNKWGGLSNTDAHLRGAINYCRNRYGTFNNALRMWYSRSPHWW